MGNLLIVANWLLPLLYLALLIDYGAAFFLKNPRPGRSCWLPALLVAHLAFLALLAVRAGRVVPVTGVEILSVLAASTTAVYWIMELISAERRTGAFVLLGAFLMQYTASVLLGTSPQPTAPPAHPAGVHIVLSIVAYTALTIAAIHGLLYLVARRGLKQHHLGLLFDRLPPLDLLGTMNWHATLVGFAFMTLAVLTGAAMYALGSHMHPSLGGLNAKVLTKILAGSIAWVVYAIAVGGKKLGRWPLARVSLVTVIGFFVVIAMLVASIVLSYMES